MTLPLKRLERQNWGHGSSAVPCPMRPWLQSAICFSDHLAYHSSRWQSLKFVLSCLLLLGLFQVASWRCKRVSLASSSVRGEEYSKMCQNLRASSVQLQNNYYRSVIWVVRPGLIHCRRVSHWPWSGKARPIVCHHKSHQALQARIFSSLPEAVVYVVIYVHVLCSCCSVVWLTLLVKGKYVRISQDTGDSVVCKRFAQKQ